MSKKITITNAETGETILETPAGDGVPFEKTDFDFRSDSDLPGPVATYAGQVEKIIHTKDKVEVTTKELVFAVLPEELPPFAKVGDVVTIELQFNSMVWISK